MPQTATSAADDPPSDPLLAAAGEALRAPRWHLTFPPVLEARMEADQGDQRRRQFVTSGIVALLVYDLFLFNDLLIRPEAFVTALWCRLGLMSGFGLVVLALIHRGLPARWREGLMASTLVVATVASGEILRATHSAAGVYDPFAFSLIFLAGNILFSLRFLHAIVASVAAFAVCAAYFLSSVLLPLEAKSFAMSLMTGTAVFTMLACYRIEKASRDAYLRALIESLRAEAVGRTAERMTRLSFTDPLTALPNRRAFDRALGEARRPGPNPGRRIGLLLIDVDHFKRYNDHYGHPAGDDCLRWLASAMAHATARKGLLARIGGEEFALLLPDAQEAMLVRQARKIRRTVEALALPHDGIAGQTRVTVSVGAALAEPTQEPGALLAAADRALYLAKQRGRNTWVMAPHADVLEDTARIA